MPYLSPAPEVEAEAVKHMEHHKHLIEHNVRVDFLFRSDVPKKGDKEVWSKTSIASRASYTTYYAQTKLRDPLAHMEAETDEADPEAFFIICMSKPIWEKLDAAARAGETDHALQHCGIKHSMKGERILFIEQHTIEDFDCILARHGLWSIAARQMLAALAARDEVRQLVLDFDGQADQRRRERQEREKRQEPQVWPGADLIVPAGDVELVPEEVLTLSDRGLTSLSREVSARIERFPNAAHASRGDANTPASAPRGGERRGYQGRRTGGPPRRATDSELFPVNGGRR